MKGAEPVPTIVYLVLGGILLGVLAFIIFSFSPWGTKTIKAMVEDWLTPTSPEETLFIKAVKCAYYRCTEGCGSGKVKISWEDEDGNKVSCVKNFCKPEWRDKEGKICDDNAKKYPVKITLEGEVEISVKKWSEIVPLGLEIYQTDCEPQKPIFRGAVPPLSSALCVPKTVECEKVGIAVKDIQSCILPEGEYNLSAAYASPAYRRATLPDVLVCK